MFVQDDDLIEVKIYYKKAARNQYRAYTEKEFKTIKEENRKGFSILNLKMKELTWGLHNTLQEDAMVENAAGERVFNYKIWKESRVKKLIKEWDAKDKDGKPVPINDNSISHLSPNIAEAITRAYDDLALLGEEEEKKS